MPTVVVKAKFS